MRKHRCHGSALAEILLATLIGALAMALGVSSFVLALRAVHTGSDALVLQRECDEILNMRIAPQVRVLQNVISAGEGGLVYQYLSPALGSFETCAFVFHENAFYHCSNIPYTGYPEDLIDYFDGLGPETEDAKVLGRYVQDVLFSFRDGGNNLVAMTDGTVDDVTAIEIVDVRLTLARDRQVYQVSNSFIPIRQFL